MIKVTENNKKFDEVDYPCLMVGEETGVIVLFDKAKRGIVVKPVDRKFKIGFYCETWEMDLFTPYQGSITLENQRG